MQLTHAAFARVQVLQPERPAEAGDLDVHTWRSFRHPATLIVDQPSAQNKLDQMWGLRSNDIDRVYITAMTSMLQQQ